MLCDGSEVWKKEYEKVEADGNGNIGKRKVEHGFMMIKDIKNGKLYFMRMYKYAGNSFCVFTPHVAAITQRVLRGGVICELFEYHTALGTET